MDTPRPIIAINYYFNAEELNNRIFASDCRSAKAVGLKAFRTFMGKRDVEVVTLDTVDFHDANVKYVLYFEYNWRMLKRDPFLDKIPYQKRALVLLEPANVNPSMYYTDFLRKRFHVVFTWDLKLLAKHPRYAQINVPVGAEPRSYRCNRFRDYSFSNKKLLVAVSANRGGYMPQSIHSYNARRKAYRFFEKYYPAHFDLYGLWWDQPRNIFEKRFGYSPFRNWRGTISGSWDEKVNVIAKYKFALCFENNVSQDGYISEKIIDCFCARCVPVYYGSTITDQRIPRDTYVDFRDFPDLETLARFLNEVDEERHQQYIEAIDRFMISVQSDFFSTDHFHQVIADRLIG
ncbi:MAG: hypothetical protein FJ222_00470 [Lentisphaerae bacterium]|nr:hypothetical protein [Lentisphaerota bacterium]